MKIIDINVKDGYKVYIGENLIDKSGEILKQTIKATKIAIITDTNVEVYYLDEVKAVLESSGYAVVTKTVEAGEHSKNMENVSILLEFLAENKMTRTDCVVALGGGVIGDLAGYTAASYMRGIDFVQMPTTLLAAVDSSVGGKTGVNLKAGKNLAGAFHQAKCVICDTACLKTLPKSEYDNGIAEAIKTAILYNVEMFDIFAENAADKHLEDIIANCVAYKGSLVEIDEFEHRERKLLNLGHTVAHAIEKCSDYSIAHGKAVAIGMAIIARYSSKVGYCDKVTADKIIEVLKINGLPTKTDFSTEDLKNVILNDKKRSSDKLTIIVPRKIGTCSIETIDVKMIENLIDLGR